MNRYLFFLFFIGWTQLSFANISDAENIAKQAGAISGAALACGQDTQLLTSRLQEVFSVMQLTQVELNRVNLIYLQAMNQAKALEIQQAKIACDQVLKDYNSLPLLRPDYQQTVLPSMHDVPTTTNPQENTQIQQVPQATMPQSSIPQTITPNSTMPN
ncbi:MAG: hypothetical protein LEGION0398_MBIBDBAK_01195 [Legionellaceae bacterium]